MAINPDWLAKAEGNCNYHQGGRKLNFLTLCFLMVFNEKWVAWLGIVNKGGIKG
ncbi:hypothetical protein KLVA111896_07080 [Klebsiella variicola]|nr:hypothetical protein SB5610_01781 [Klebsiella variicola]